MRKKQANFADNNAFKFKTMNEQIRTFVRTLSPLNKTFEAAIILINCFMLKEIKL